MLLDQSLMLPELKAEAGANTFATWLETSLFVRDNGSVVRPINPSYVSSIARR